MLESISNKDKDNKDKSEEDNIKRLGWLKKKGSKINVWNDRYFVLRGPTLSYYVKNTESVSR